jgi:hypothetical protein
MAEREAFKFPDEIEDKKEAKQDDLEIEVIDDTPEQDKGREPMPKKIVEELENDDLEEYSEKVKTRLSQMKKVWHDERREKESALREREEALRFAQAKDQEIKNLRERLGAGEKKWVEDATKATETEVSAAKNKLKQAYESGDAELIAEAQEALTDAKIKLKEYEYRKPSLQSNEESVKSEQQVQAAPQVVDPKAAKWRETNTWFGADPEMTASALGLHEKLVRSGVDPRSEDYYQRVDSTMRKRFPEYEWGDEPQTSREQPGSTRQTESETKDSETKSPRKSANVAPVTRSTAPRQIRLTTTQVALAKKLGLTNEAYAKELMKLENRNG